MSPEAIWNRIKSILATELPYMKKVYEGITENIPLSHFPCIVMEPVSDPESRLTYPVVEPTFTISIMGYMKVYKKGDRQIVGDATTKGILDIERDIKLAIGKHEPQLGTEALFVEYGAVEFDFTSYPIRGVTIETRIRYRQNVDTR